MNHEELASMRRNYVKHGLLEDEASADPFALFELWLEQAIATELAPYEPNAMNLSTVDSRGQPHCRILLLKDFDRDGFVFYTNYQSNKACELAENQQACMTFYWPVLERQVRIEGVVDRVSSQVSDAYFASRPLGSRIGAWASQQSRVIESRASLELEVRKVQEKFGPKSPPRPQHWGGYCLRAQLFEFWQGRADRLHDRLLYQPAQPSGWLRHRLAP